LYLFQATIIVLLSTFPVSGEPGRERAYHALAVLETAEVAVG